MEEVIRINTRLRLKGSDWLSSKIAIFSCGKLLSAAPNYGVEFCQKFISAIRSSAATLYNSV